MPAICVYCSSSNQIAPSFLAAAYELGQAIAVQNWTLIYGGNAIGAMGQLADGARSKNGTVIGINTQHFHDKNITDPHCNELIITPTLRDRKALMEQRADAFVTLPGGLGTLEELFEIITAKTLGLHHKPIVIVNVENFYTPLLEMLDHAITHHFIRPHARQHWHIAQSIPQAIELLKSLLTTHP